MGIGLVAVWAILSLTSFVLSRFGICITFILLFWCVDNVERISVKDKCHFQSIESWLLLFQGSEATPSVGIADRARHPDELKQDSGNWLIDIDYYISQQVLLDHLLSAHS